MGFKPRGYDKVSSESKTRDYSLFAIACEGTKREPEYFKLFNEIDRIKVDIIENEIGHRDSAPTKVLERVKLYIEDVGLSEKDNDSLWCIIDVDEWPREQIEELAEFCSNYVNYHILVSNPCFEIWLLYHKLKSLDSVDCSSSQKVKDHLHKLEKGGYYYLNYLPLMKTAINNARSQDANDKHFYPFEKSTKVYLLGEALINKMGEVRFDSFIQKCKTLSKMKSKQQLNRQK